MKIYTAHWKCYTDDYYSPHNRRMFLNREDADKSLDDLLNYEGIEHYYILEEEVEEGYSPLAYLDDDDDDEDYPCDIVNEF